MFSIPSYGLGFPNEQAQSAYYPEGDITKDEVAQVSRALEERSVYPENTRIRKIRDGPTVRYQVLQASVETTKVTEEINLVTGETIEIVRGDHAAKLAEICSCLSEAAEFANNDTQRMYLSQYVESFRTGSLDVYRESQRTWIQDKNPRVENIFGFVEPYRDQYGIRAEFEGLAAISDTEETTTLLKLVDASDMFIKRLPWATGNASENNDKGPFEKAMVEPPDFVSIHSKLNRVSSH